MFESHDYHERLHEHFPHMGRFMSGKRGRRGHGCGRGGHGGRGRGDLQYVILAAIENGPRHGYDIIQEIETRTGRRPNPGEVYPVLQMLDDAGYVRGEERDGKRIYAITDRGRELLAERPQPGDEGDHDAIYAALGEALGAIRGIKDAARHIARSADVEHFKKAVKALERTQRELFAILSEEPSED